MPLIKAYNLFDVEEVNIFTENDVDESRGIVNYGKDNSIPQQLINSIDGSHTANSCISTIVDFITGNGLSSKELEDTVINRRGDKLDDLHKLTASDIGYFYGVAFIVKYNKNLKKSDVYQVPFEQVRIGRLDDKGKITDYVHNPYFGTEEGDDKKYDTRYFPYNPDPDIVRKQIRKAKENGYEFKGQIYYKIVQKPGKRYYPLPSYASGIEWFEIEQKIGRFHNTNISNNFMLSCLMTVIGDPEAPVEEDEKGNVLQTASEELDDNLTSIFSGHDNAGKVFVRWVKSLEEKGEIEAFPNNVNDKLFESLQRLTTDNISIATNVPPVLANIQTAGKLGSTQEIINAIELMQKRVVRLQQMLEACYTELLTGLNVNGVDLVLPDEIKIGKFNPIDSIKDQVWEVLTDDEKRQFASEHIDIELQGKDEQDVNSQAEANARANLRGSVGGVTAMMDLITKIKEGMISEESGVAILKITYGYTEEESKEILNGEGSGA